MEKIDEACVFLEEKQQNLSCLDNLLEYFQWFCTNKDTTKSKCYRLGQRKKSVHAVRNNR